MNVNLVRMELHVLMMVVVATLVIAVLDMVDVTALPCVKRYTIDNIFVYNCSLIWNLSNDIHVQEWEGEFGM